jgi:hypothetical protein
MIQKLREPVAGLPCRQRWRRWVSGWPAAAGRGREPGRSDPRHDRQGREGGAARPGQRGHRHRDQGGRDFRSTYEQHDAIASLENVVYLGLNDDLIWPGALVSGTNAHQFVFEPISIARGPITLSVSLEGSGSTGPLSVRVDDPKLSTVRQGIADLLRAPSRPARRSARSTTARSRSPTSRT